MAKVFNYYMDDSGSRCPDRNPGRKAKHGYDWFSLGGVIVAEEDEGCVRELHSQFLAKWNIGSPLHSAEIRARSDSFHWLERLDDDTQKEFYEDLFQLMVKAPVIGIACVIDRPGYNHRYKEIYGDKRWSLCKTAFDISVERASKYAHSHDRVLRVMPERCSKKNDAILKGYYNNLKHSGMPFNKESMGGYAPFEASDFSGVLYEFRTKAKTSPLAQIADLYLWPICIGGYHESNRPYKRLLEEKKLIDCYLDSKDVLTTGIKYSCFDLVERKA